MNPVTAGKPDKKVLRSLDELLLLAMGASHTTPVDAYALHLYFGIDSSAGNRHKLDDPLRQLWDVAEQLQLLFEADAIWMRSKSSANVAVASLMLEEREKLSGLLWEGDLPPGVQQNSHGKARWTSAPRNLGETVQGKDLANNKLAKARSWINLEIDRPDGAWQMALLYPVETSKLAEWLMQDASGFRAKALLAGLATLEVQFNLPAESSPERPWRPDREQLIEELKDLSVRKFQEEYARRRKPIHTILTILHGVFTRLLRETLGRSEDLHSIVFSYRKPEDSCIYFIPTDEQAREFVNEKEDISPFLAFCKFGYPRNKALSGWVLSTGMCDYTEQFSEDGRWKEWLQTDKDGLIADQLMRVKRFLQRGRSLPHVYLVPILTAPTKSGDHLETVLMASISVASPLSADARAEIFDFAVRMRPAVEMAMDAQTSLEEQQDHMASEKKVEKWWQTWQAVAAAVVTILGGLFGLLKEYPELVKLYTPTTPAIVLGVNPIPMSAVTILATRGDYYARQHLAVTTTQYATGRDALDALLAGKAQFATVAETPLVLAALAQQRLVVVATMAESKEETQLVVRSDQVHSIADLKGKTIATARGTNADYFMDALLRRSGVKPESVKILSMKPVEMVDAFSKGNIAGYVVWQPFVAKGLQLKDLHPVAYSGNGFYTMTFNIVTSRDYISKHPDDVRKFLLALKEADDEIKHDPAEAEDAVADKTGMERQVLDELWPKYDFNLRLDDTLLHAMEQQRAWAQQAGNFPDSNTKFRGFLAPEALRSISPEAVNLH